QALLIAPEAAALRRMLANELAAAHQAADPLLWAAILGNALARRLAQERAATAAAEAEAAALRARLAHLEQTLADQQQRYEARLAAQEAELSGLRHIVARQQLQLHALLDNGE
ncbi:MAG: hypothetical protein WHX53_16545, partial [Anaerolineae bacterium]